MSQWQRDGQPGARPEPSAPKLEAELKRLEQDELALLAAIDSVTNERVAFVAKNRARLVKDAAQAEDKARERALRAVDELEAAREGLVEARRVRLWCELYPAQETMREPVWAWLAGGMKRVVASLGITVQAPAAETVFAALREDVGWIATAMARDQQSKLGGPAAGRSRTAIDGSMTSPFSGRGRGPMRAPPWPMESRDAGTSSAAWDDGSSGVRELQA